jgi:hypothetical protein
VTAARNVSASFVEGPARLANLSSRLHVGVGQDVMIAGFVIGGAEPKRVAIVATGPSLAAAGVTQPLGNPRIAQVRSSDQSVIATNDNWQSTEKVEQLLDAGFAPSSPAEAALMADLAPGAYTAIVSGVGDTTGISVIGIYEAGDPTTALLNISTRGRVLNGVHLMIGGFVVQGNGPQRVAIVATGPSLVDFGVQNPLADPVLSIVRSSDQSVVASNDNWLAGPYATELQSAGLAPSSPLESGVVLTLEPGAYTAVVTGAGGVTGVGVVGIYRLD